MYELNAGQKRSPIRERFYITVSNPIVPDPIEAHFMMNHTAPSRFRDEVAETVYFDCWMGSPGSFAECRKFLDDMAEIGLHRIWISFQRWQYGGYATLETKFAPARAEFGGPTEMKALATRARQLGYRFGLRAAYAVLSSDYNNPYWDPNDTALDHYGKIKIADFGGGPGHKHASPLALAGHPQETLRARDRHHRPRLRAQRVVPGHQSLLCPTPRPLTSAICPRP